MVIFNVGRLFFSFLLGYHLIDSSFYLMIFMIYSLANLAQEIVFWNFHHFSLD